MTELTIPDVTTNVKYSKKEYDSKSDATKDKSTVFRPIHYLGSKLRLLEELDFFVNDIAPNSNTFCDLFAGSGTVSQHFISSHNVISVDIQEYSKVISSAISAPSNSLSYNACAFVENCKSSQLYKTLLVSSEELRGFEDAAIQAAQNDELSLSCDLLEDGCIEYFKLGEPKPKNRTLLEFIERLITELHQRNLIDSKDSMVFRYFGGIYFSYYQAICIDSILCEINKLPEEDKNTFLAAILSTVSDIVNTVGKQFAQPIKPRKSDGTPKSSLKNQLKKDRYKDVFNEYEKWLDKYLCLPKADKCHISIKEDFGNFLKSNKNKIDVFYADPPYTRDHYSRYYHILETICLRDNPKISTVKINNVTSLSRGIYRENRHQSPFCIKSQAKGAFDILFSNVKKHDAPLLLSYSPFEKESNNRPRVLGVDEIVLLAKTYFESVDVYSVGDFSHSKLNNTQNNYKTVSAAEVLIICK
jgi:adenine-specific DNA methylase